MANKFAFIIHPLGKRDVARMYPIARYLPERLVEWLIKHKSPFVVSHITGIRSAEGTEGEGWFIACPLTPRQLLTLPEEEVWSRLTKAAELAQSLGAGIIGLGAFTSVVGDGGKTLADRVDIAVTTGNSYTVATAIQGVFEAAKLLEIDPATCTAAVVGATGSIGKTCARLLGRSFGKLVLVGRDQERLEQLAAEIAPAARSEVTLSTSVASALPGADVIVTVSSAVDAIINPEDLKPGAIVCDVARPRDVSVRVSRERKDVLVIEGGVVEVPGDVQFNFDFGFPAKTAYACMSETISLALAGRFEDFTLGKDVSVEQVDEISAIAEEQGFRLAGFRSFERAVLPEAIARVRKAIASRNSS